MWKRDKFFRKYFACKNETQKKLIHEEFKKLENNVTFSSDSHQRCSVKMLNKVFLEISQNSQENTCARVSFLIKLQA